MCHCDKRWGDYKIEGFYNIIYRSTISRTFVRILLVKRMLLYKRISFVWKMIAVLFVFALMAVHATEKIRE